MALYIVATPIGNLNDLSIRALKVLKEVDLILCEDTRVTQKLLAYHGIRRPVLSYHQHSGLQKVNHILDPLKKGKNLALVCNAGTPGISDPGSKLISEILKDNQLKNTKIVPIPGPSAVIAAASISGFPMDKFIFMGFPPTKKKRKKFFEEAINSKYPVIFYESPYRILKTLAELKDISQKLEIVLCRELTKKFETVYRGKIEEVTEELKKGEIRGEFVVIINISF